jgi:hypothetical protein
MTTSTTYYALWYYFTLDDKIAHAISDRPDTLLALHEESIKNPDACYHDFKDIIEEIKVEPIECYTYIPEIQVFEPYCEHDKKKDHAFYAFNALPTKEFDITENEVLIYMSTSIHATWEYHSDQFQACRKRYGLEKSFQEIMDLCAQQQQQSDHNDFHTKLPSLFYTSWPSHDPVEFNKYYEDGIMNA